MDWQLHLHCRRRLHPYTWLFHLPGQEARLASHISLVVNKIVKDLISLYRTSKWHADNLVVCRVPVAFESLLLRVWRCLLGEYVSISESPVSCVQKKSY